MNFFNRLTAAVAAVATCVLTLVGCDQQKIDTLEEGLSTEVDVRKAFGEPETIWPETDGSRTFEYPRQPMGHRNYMITIGPGGIALVPEGRRIFPRMTVIENLQMGTAHADPANYAADIARVFAMFPILEERQSQRAGTLSGGEQQMLAIGRALMSRPKLLLLDEPSLGLAPIYIRKIFQIVKELNRDHGMTILLVEQNANMALNASDYGYVLENGRIVMEDSCDKLREKEDIREFYLGMKEAGVRGERRWKKKKTWR